MRTYFLFAKLDSGEYVNILYSTEYKKGTSNHLVELYETLRDNSIKLADGCLKFGKKWKESFDNIYIDNSKNRDEQCFEDYRVIDLR